MKEGLNLLPSVAKFQAARINLKKKIGKVMAIFLAVWVLSIITIFTLWGIKGLLLKTAKKNNVFVLDKYKSLVTNVVLSKKNKYQAKLVSTVLSQRFEYGESIKKITTIFSENINLENFEIKNKKQFVLKYSVANGIDVKEVEEKIRDINDGFLPDFKSAKLNSIGVKDNVWSLEMEVELK